MDCGKCGAEIEEAAGACPECGQPTPAAAESLAPPTGDAIPMVAEDAPAAPKARGRSRVLEIVVAVVVIALVAAAGWFIVTRVSFAASPEAVAKQMFDAYAQFDAKTMLTLSTRDTIKEADAKQFQDQAATAKAAANGAPMLKDIVVGPATITTDTATLEVTAQWLDDPTTGKYAQRTDKITLVKRDGKWLVKLF
jgi:flagellar basal body-associated protein FliL